MKNAIVYGTEVHQVESEAVGDTFEIIVSVPELAADEPLPVIYGTDATSMTGTYVESIGGLIMGGEIPPAIFVGIAYPISGNFQEWIRLRARDFMSTEFQEHQELISQLAEKEVKGGGADKFLQFLTSELRDWVSANYNVSDDTTYVGDSMGGFFGTYVLLHKPESFKRYVIGSPWLIWDYPLAFDYEEKYASEHDDLEAIVYMAAGAEEHILGPHVDPIQAGIFRDAKTAELCQRMIDKLESRNYSSLNLTGKILEDETHFTILGALVNRGLRRVFNV